MSLSIGLGLGIGYGGRILFGPALGPTTSGIHVISFGRTPQPPTLSAATDGIIVEWY